MNRLGIDIGRVLIEPEGRADTSFIGGTLADALATPPYEGMFDVVPALVRRFEGRVWLISKAGPSIQEKTRLWLRHHRFFERTGVPPDNLRFCLERPQKAGHCSALGITHFIDDRADVLGHLDGVVRHRFLFGPQRKPRVPRGAVPVIDWAAAADAVIATLMAELAA